MLLLKIFHIENSEVKLSDLFGNGYPTTIVDRPMLASWVSDSW